MKAIDILREKLQGNQYSRFSLGDIYELYFDGIWLISQSVKSFDEIQLNNQITSAYLPALEVNDREGIAKTIILCSTLRKNVVDVVLAPDSTLELIFENGMSLFFPTNIEMVDWQWALTASRQGQYTNYLVGVFEYGKVKIVSQSPLINRKNKRLSG